MVQIVYLPADVGVVARTLRVGEYVSRLLLKTGHRLCFSVEQGVFPLLAIIDAPGALELNLKTYRHLSCQRSHQRQNH